MYHYRKKLPDHFHRSIGLDHMRKSKTSEYTSKEKYLINKKNSRGRSIKLPSMDKVKNQSAVANIAKSLECTKEKKREQWENSCGRLLGIVTICLKKQDGAHSGMERPLLLV
ncbi:hypothetical protein JTE90_003216 [Oedothorax gibbosus]|uniref:Uncharacterized protein n=1 Tax=Oedothorax gibbosus TaxID=931172 RepID=A0AAV6TGI1_9ARAC|nr:hypothetical protein JTE90_003216 [Oedothorax gibbosus]